MSAPDLVVFDLDGTLVDSRVDLCNSVNATLEHYGKAKLPAEVISGYIGDGASMLVSRALNHAEGEPQGQGTEMPREEDALAWFLAFYKVHLLDFTFVYDGVMEALSAIRERRPHLPMAVLTNKPVKPSRRICEHFGLNTFFFANYGGDSFASKKPEPEGLERLVQEAGERLGRRVAARDVVMVGDSHVDVETARAFGARSLGCLYGLSPESLRAARPDLLCENAAEWPGLLEL